MLLREHLVHHTILRESLSPSEARGLDASAQFAGNSALLSLVDHLFLLNQIVVI